MDMGVAFSFLPPGVDSGRADYQLAFRMPGILPSRASLRSMIREILNLRYTPLERPVSWHRRTVRLEYFGVLLLLAIWALVVI
jgi:hypothetical protein